MWWTFGVLFYKVVGLAMTRARAEVVGDDPFEAVDLESLLGPDDGVERHKVVKMARWKKTVEWLNDMFTLPRIATFVCSMQTLLSLMGAAFKESRLRNSCSVVRWLIPSTSPAARTILSHRSLAG